MKDLIISLVVSALIIYLGAYFFDDVLLDGPLAAILTAAVLGIANATVKPILKVLTLPITIITLGLFLLVVNAAVILLVSWLVPGFQVVGWGTAIFFGIFLWLGNWISCSVLGDGSKE